MTKPWEEHWEQTNVDRVLTTGREFDETVLTSHGASLYEQSARARLAACAPEAIRLLLNITALLECVCEPGGRCLACDVDGLLRKVGAR